MQTLNTLDLEEIKKILSSNPGYVDQIDEDGIPLFMLGAKQGSLPITKYLVEYSRASMNTVDANNRTILHYAAMSGNVELNQYLVEKVGMDICAGDKDLITPYQIAFEANHKQLLAYYERMVGAPYEDLYHNPIRTGMFPDPSIVRVDDDYYMVNSSFIYFPCIPISHSKDLLHWKIIGHAITNPEWAVLDELEGGRGYWAPDISYNKGIFYITATYRLNDTDAILRRQIVVSSNKPEGPYSKPCYIDEDGIDPSLFHDEDGRHYMLLNRGARILELDNTCKKQITEAKLLYYGAQKRVPEGPHLLKKDGWYYLFLAEGGTGPGHRITVARSKELFGNYEPCPYNPIMRQQDEKAGIQRCGHGKPVCTQNGEWYMVYLCGRRLKREGQSFSILGRETALDPITWTLDGWPLVNHLKGPSVIQKKPFIELNKNTVLSIEEQGKDDKEWMSPRPPENDGIEISENRFRIKGSIVPLSSVAARNILVRRQTAFAFDATATMKIPDLQKGQEAGLTCYYDENSYLCFYLGREKEELFVQVKEHIGFKDVLHEKKILSDNYETFIGKEIKLEVETNGFNRTFYYELNGQDKVEHQILSNVYYLSDEGVSIGKRFTGAMVGMYAYGGNIPLFVEFAEWRYLCRKR